MEIKICNDPKCEQTNPQPLANFDREKTAKGGYRNQCKSCRRRNYRWWKDHHRAAFNAYMRDYNKTKKARRCQLSRRLKVRYGLTIKDYEAILKSQKGGCKLCGRGPKKHRRLAIDHCHNTGRVRGLLCDGCNRSLAILEDKITLAKAIDYINSIKEYPVTTQA